jgi:hypothetical protein
MTEYFKQIVDAWGDRLRSPVLGSVLIFFVATNWQSLFYLFFADEPVRARLLYFDANTDGWSLYGLPVIGGVVLAIAVPWISLAGAFLAKFPRAFLHEVQSSEALKRRIVVYRLKADEEEAKASFEEAKASAEEARERSKIDAAKRLNEAGNVSEQLKSEIQTGREEELAVPELSDRELKVLNFAASFADGRFKEKHGELLDPLSANEFNVSKSKNTHKERRLIEKTVEKLLNGGFIERIGLVNGTSVSGLYEITVKGYSAVDQYINNSNNPTP